MANGITWQIKVGKEVFYKRLKQPKKIFFLFVAVAFLGFLILQLALEIEAAFSIPRTITYFTSFLLLILIAIYTYQTNRELFKDELRNYKVDTEGVTMKGKFYPWSNYTYFQDDSKLIENVSDMLPPIFPEQKNDRWIIQLLVKRFSDKGKLILVMDDEAAYKNVSQVVKDKLKDASNIS